jgi:hypothetical protein
MTEARDVIYKFMFGKAQDMGTLFGDGVSEYAKEDTDTILTALRDAGFAVVDKSQFKIKLNSKSMSYLDDMAEAEEAMDGRHALKILLSHYRAMLKAAQGDVG